MRLTLALLLGAFVFAQAQPPTESALLSDPKGWVDLLADHSLKDWVRVPLGAAGQVRAGLAGDPSPWTLDPSGPTLVCEGDKAGHEMLRHTTEWADHIVHVEWRFTRLEGERPYNSGIYVRTAGDGAIWHQAQTGAAGGYLFGNTLVNGTPQRVNLRQSMSENRVKPAGEWNTYEIRAVGPRISLWVNGAVTSEFADGEVPTGFVGLEAEGFLIEFRNLKVKRLAAPE
ncbi:MAG TPA: DUF1080 domain-containing protein [Vicinamibacterales bacterium]|nr:DUF1080 domain-containing protein [Vicinamibacterales bacterium]